MLLEMLARTSDGVARTSGRLAKVELLAECLRRMDAAEVSAGVAYLSGRLPQGTVGVGWASLRGLPPPAPPPRRSAAPSCCRATSVWWPRRRSARERPASTGSA